MANDNTHIQSPARQQTVAARVHPRSTPALSEFMAHGWASRESPLVFDRSAVTLAARRRAEIAAEFPGELLVIPAGSAKVRSNDVTYYFRPHTSFAQLTGLGAAADPDAVLAISVDDRGRPSATLFIQPSTGPGTEGFYLDVAGEYWLGRRATMDELAGQLEFEVRHIGELGEILKSSTKPIRAVRGASDEVDRLLTVAEIVVDSGRDAELRTALDELRLVKDAWEIEQMTRAVAITAKGFEDVVESLPRATSVPRGERVIESVFQLRARTDGNDIGYGSTAAAGNNATTLHWDVCDGPVREGDLVLLDAGAELETLYTADITRTLPVSGRFSPVQRKVYDAVLEAADAAIAAAVVGSPFQDTHDAAVSVLAGRLEEWGILPVSAAVSLSNEGQHHRRWMPHATSHHLGLDVHDCAAARHEEYRGAVIREGMVFTVEPGLYFKEDDELVPEEFRGIGIRIEDDIVATSSGPVNLSAALPRAAADVEEWMAPLLESGRVMVRNHRA